MLTKDNQLDKYINNTVTQLKNDPNSTSYHPNEFVMNNCKTEARSAFKQALNDYKVSTGRAYAGLTTAGQKYAR